ncbi:Glycosyltransferase involved in cell wall bisynthesis [Tessaracoccus oleiagri]|uniref:Glycosyltransferase involved in cell wall bisynthesis n=2 Tax=Tessaracoccus oleiagri TaxID=686624 RepID=A0A1G9HGH1_9ACTN|nr:Glycosyltransferase involved in cell wall bisynthesis [Tessaracoccus oleiagri]
MRVTFASSHGRLGGGEVMLLTMVGVAISLGHDVTVVAPSSPRDVLDRAEDYGARVVAIPGHGWEYLTRLRSWDVRHRDGLLWCNGLGPAFATAGGPNRVVSFHELPSRTGKLAVRFSAKGTRMVTVPSEWMRGHLGIDSRVLGNWTQFDARKPPCFEGFPTHRPIRLGFLGRVTRSKGAVVLARAVERLNRADPGRYHLVVGGETRFADRPEAEEIQSALGLLEPRPVMLGWVPPEDFFRQVDLAVFPSVAPEAFGLVAAEAMAFGVPFVVTDAGALAGVSGKDPRFVARPDDVDSLVDAIRAAVEHYTDEHVQLDYQRWQDFYSPSAGRVHFEILLRELAGDYS